MPPISHGFRGRRGEEAEAGRVPQGQYVTPDFPVLSAGPTPHQSLESWSFEIRGELDEARSWTWAEFTALPSERITVDIHCVTKWSKLDTTWTGVSLDTLLDGGPLGRRLELFARPLKAMIDRTAYGVSWNADLPMGGRALSNDVELTAELEFVRAA
jgi:DMSO/TMAO reductase YedYZ molybdopterin-dependent catalytic subunit